MKLEIKGFPSRMRFIVVSAIVIMLAVFSVTRGSDIGKDSKKESLNAIVVIRDGSDEYEVLVRNLSDATIYIWGLSLEIKDSKGEFLDNRGAGFTRKGIESKKTVILRFKLMRAADAKIDDLNASRFSLSFSREKDGHDFKKLENSDIYMCE